MIDKPPKIKHKAETHQAQKDHGIIVTAINAVIIGAVMGLFIWGFLGIANPIINNLNPLFQNALYVGAITLGLSWIYAFVTLDGVRPGSMHRERYLDFRSMLGDDGVASLYSRGLRRALKAIDRFFRDETEEGKKSNLGLFPNAFGLLREPAPLLTANSYDRCLQFAITYPLLVLFVGWALSGEVHLLEDALQMKQVNAFQRASTAVAFIIAVLALRKGFKTSSPRHVLIGIVASWFTTNYGAGVALIGAVGALSATGPGAVIGAFGAVAITSGGRFSLALGFIALAFVIQNARARGSLGPALAIFTFVMLPVALILPVIHTIGSNEISISVLFFFCALTLINAPFDWLALGISRALLRRGLEKGGLAPLWLGLADVLISLVIMTLLATTVLFAAVVIDYMTSLGGNAPLLNPPAFINEMKKSATLGNTRYWWLYAMLFSTQIPALVNLIFGIFCFLRGSGSFNKKMFESLPHEGAVEYWHKIWIATGWSTQLGLAVAVGMLGAYALLTLVLPVIDLEFASCLVSNLDALSVQQCSFSSSSEDILLKWL